MIIAVDAMGGDFAPEEIVFGTLIAARQYPDHQFCLVGDKAKIGSALGSRPTGSIIVIPSSSVITGEAGIGTIRTDREASIVKTALLAGKGLKVSGQKELLKADAMVAFGNTGVAISAATIHMGRLAGIARPAIANLLPGGTLMVDGGAVSDCSVDNLMEFTALGIAYQMSRGITFPRVAPLSIGEESYKGNELTREFHQRLSALYPGHFLGRNIEGRDLLIGLANVVVVDGFAGNVALKSMEAVVYWIKKTIQADRSYWLPLLLALWFIKKAKRELDPRSHGGAPLLGVNGVCIIGHGNSKRDSVAKGIETAVRAVKNSYIDHLVEGIESLRGRQSAIANNTA